VHALLGGGLVRGVGGDVGGDGAEALDLARHGEL
jgi:hypothetical protein